MTIYDAVPYGFTLLAGFLGGVFAGLWLALSGRVAKVTVSPKIISSDQS